MNRYRIITWLVVVVVFAICGIAFAQEDREGCKDHPMFTRMPNFYISDCEEKDFDQTDFKDEKGKEIKVEGKFTLLIIGLKKTIKHQALYKLYGTTRMPLKKLAEWLSMNIYIGTTHI